MILRSTLNLTHIALHTIPTWLDKRRDFSCHLFHTKSNHWAKPARSDSVMAACGATVVSRSPFMFHQVCFVLIGTRGRAWILLQPQCAHGNQGLSSPSEKKRVRFLEFLVSWKKPSKPYDVHAQDETFLTVLLPKIRVSEGGDIMFIQ